MDRFEYRYRINGHIHVHMHGPTSTLEANCPRLRVFTLFLHLHTRRATYSMAMHAGCIPRKELTKRWCIYEATPAEFISVQRVSIDLPMSQTFSLFLTTSKKSLASAVVRTATVQFSFLQIVLDRFRIN